MIIYKIDSLVTKVLISIRFLFDMTLKCLIFQVWIKRIEYQ
jgi:hypothetical protein